MIGRLSLLLFVPVFVAPVLAQTVISVRVGQDANDVSGIAEWQTAEQVALNARGIPVRPTDTFPAFVAVQGDVSVSLGTATRIGGHIGFGSTSGRLDYSDFSGSARADRQAERVFGGATAGRRLAKLGPTTFWVEGSVRLSRVSVAYDRAVTVGETEIEALSTTYSGWSGSVEPGVAYGVTAGPIEARIHAGWEAALGGSLDAPGGPDAAWAGSRLGFSLGVRL